MTFPPNLWKHCMRIVEKWWKSISGDPSRLGWRPKTVRTLGAPRSVIFVKSRFTLVMRRILRFGITAILPGNSEVQLTTSATLIN
jgi:hypothetical protein